MADQATLRTRDRPPVPIRAVRIILIGVSSLLLLLFLCSGSSLAYLPFPFSLLSVVPLLAGVAVLVLLLAPAESRNWFRPDRWASTR